MSNLISVIIPIFNTAEYLNRCIDSVLAQTYSNIEVILINDGSTDGSREICEAYLLVDQRIKVHHKRNGGVSSARNAGIELASGEYLCFVDSDDYISSRMLEVLLNLAKEYNAEIAECGFNNLLFSGECEPSEFGNGIEHGTGTFQLDRFVDEDLFNGVATKMFKLSLFKEVRFPNGRIFEDNYITLYFCLEQVSYVRTREALYYYVHRENSIIQSVISPRKAREYIHFLDNMLRLIQDNSSDSIQKQQLIDHLVERNVPAYLALSLSHDRKVRKLYSRIYRKRLNYSVIQCVLSRKIVLKNKVTYLLCKINLEEFTYFLKKFFRGKEK